MSYKGRHFQIDFDFISHLLIIQTSDGSIKTIALRPRSVADFYQRNDDYHEITRDAYNYLDNAV